MSKDINQTLAERGSRYGKFEDNANISQSLESILVGGAGYEKLEDVHKEALKFICQKMSRIVNGDPFYNDNWHDIAGYSNLVEAYNDEVKGIQE